ncbi:Pecanex-like protein 1, partial [Frankliniella fusca]
VSILFLRNPIEARPSPPTSESSVRTATLALVLAGRAHLKHDKSGAQRGSAMHDLLAEFAAECLEEPDDPGAAPRRPQEPHGHNSSAVSSDQQLIGAGGPAAAGQRTQHEQLAWKCKQKVFGPIPKPLVSEGMFFHHGMRHWPMIARPLWGAAAIVTDMTAHDRSGGDKINSK